MGLIVVALAVGTALVIGLSLAPLGISRRGGLLLVAAAALALVTTAAVAVVVGIAVLTAFAVRLRYTKRRTVPFRLTFEFGDATICAQPVDPGRRKYAGERR